MDDRRFNRFAIAMTLITKTKISFDLANRDVSLLTDSVLKMPGMSGNKTRHFYNNLLHLIDDPVYLEIGVWKGSSTCAAMCDNAAKITCIDNFSQFNGTGEVKSEFMGNIARFLGKNDFIFFDADCFKLDVSQLRKHNIYLYDGGHTYEDQYKALTHYIDALDDAFVYIADDWNLGRVRQGTFDAIHDLGLKTLWSKEVILTKNDKHTPKAAAVSGWWNGIGVFVLNK